LRERVRYIRTEFYALMHISQEEVGEPPLKLMKIRRRTLTGVCRYFVVFTRANDLEAPLMDGSTLLHPLLECFQQIGLSS